MSGEELKNRLKVLGVSQAEIARRLNVIPETIGQALKAKDIKTGFLEDICRVIGKDMSFFYGGSASTSSEDVINLRQQLQSLEDENKRLKEELRMKDDPEQPKKESEMFRLWMEHMRITERMQELYQKEKEG